MRTRLVVGNWKMHGSFSENAGLLSSVAQTAAELRKSSVAICVPFPYLAQARAALDGSPATWGAQNASEHAQGAYTGEVSAAMLRDFGCRYVIVGHSERRQFYGDNDRGVALKARRVVAEGMVPIVCVGESLAEREGGQTEAVVGRQLSVVANELGASGLRTSVLAYEPVWAIGTGKTATPEQVQEVHAYLRLVLARQDQSVAEALSLLYGGSVKAANASGLFSMPDVDGGLIGGASLIASEFNAICQAADG